MYRRPTQYVTWLRYVREPILGLLQILRVKYLFKSVFGCDPVHDKRCCPVHSGPQGVPLASISSGVGKTLRLTVVVRGAMIANLHGLDFIGTFPPRFALNG